MGGLVAFQDLMIALRTLGADRPLLDIVQWTGSQSESYDMLAPYADGFISANYPPTPQPIQPPRPRSPIETSNAVSARLRRRASRMLVPSPPPPPPVPPDETLRLNGADCSFSVLINNRLDLSVPHLIWIYDLQHHHLPELLSRREREERDEVIRREAGRATRLIVKSSSIYQDLVAFLPEYEHKIRVLGWISYIPDQAYECDLKALLERYHLPEKFFYLPNQFWKHKNHSRVVEALHLLQARGVFPTIVCTGTLADHRNPDYVGEVMQRVSEYNLRAQFILLGSIERADVFGLMRQSIAVLNPSLFEGFGLSASEAKSLGKRTLLADLPSLREQAPPHAVYFDPNNVQELADKMEDLWNTVPPGPDHAMEAAARAAFPARERDFARAFVRIAQEAIDDFRAPGKVSPA